MIYVDSYRFAAGFSTEAQDYFDRLDTAGDTTYTAYKQPLANYIDGLVSNGLWSGLESAASFVGVGIQGTAVPLKSTMPAITNNNFVGADLSQTTGLKGDGTTKYLLTGVIGTDLSQNDAALTTYISALATGNMVHLGNVLSTSNSGTIQRFGSNIYMRLNGSTNNLIGAAVTGFLGGSRTIAASFDARINSTASVETATSGTPVVDQYAVFADGSGSFLSDARLATYTIGSSLNLATLEGLQDTLISEIAAV